MRILAASAARTARRALAVTAAAATGSVLVACPALAGAAASPAASYSFTVNSTADSHDADPGNGICADSQGRCTLRAAIEEADADPAGSTISIDVPAGTYPLKLGTLKASANTISVTGAGASSTVIHGNGTFRILLVGREVTATLTGVTIDDGNAGNAGYGGGVLNSGTTTVSDSTITRNRAAAGGGITNDGGRLIISGSTVSRNKATEYGGGGIQNGGLKNQPGRLKVISSFVENNKASGDGGGILNGQNGHPGTAQRPATAPRSGLAVRAAAPRPPTAPVKLIVTIRNSVIAGNTSDNAGGGIANDGGTVTVTRSTLAYNTCPHAIGGGIETYGPLTVTRSMLAGNTAKGGYGGGVEAYYGGVSGETTISQSTLVGNDALIGAGVDDSATVDITQSTLVGNQASQQGGGIEVEGGATFSVINSTVTGNSGAESGGIDAYRCGGGTVSYSTIYQNHSTGLNLSCHVVLTGTIVASSHGKNCLGSAPAETYGYNLDSGTSCRFTKSTDLNSANPDLEALFHRGGPTETNVPKPGSPVINAGGLASNGCPSTDQRGDPRPYGPACDIGSVEVQG